MNLSFSAIKDSLIAAAAYLPQTLELIIIPLAVGLVLGTLVALIRVYQVPLLAQFFAFFIPVYQGIPIVVALLIYNLIYLMEFNTIFARLGITKTIEDIDSIYVGIFALSIMMICNISEVMRGALLAIDRGQQEAAYVVGLTRIQTIKRIILPQAIPIAIPVLVNTTVGLIKATSIVYAIGIAEVLSGALIPSSRSYTFFEGYLAAALIYWGLTIIVEFFYTAMEKRAGKFRGQ